MHCLHYFIYLTYLVCLSWLSVTHGWRFHFMHVIEIQPPLSLQLTITSVQLTYCLNLGQADGCHEVLTGSVTTHAKEINPLCSGCLLRADFQTCVMYKARAKVCSACLWSFLFNQCCRWLPKKNNMINLLTSPASDRLSMAEAQVQALNLPPSMFFSLHLICLLVICLTIFWLSHFYASSLSEYFANKVEEKKETEKQEEEGQEGEEKKEEEEEEKVAPTLAARPSVAASQPKKGGKGFTLFNSNIFCNTDIYKGPKKHPVSCSKGLVTLSWPFWSQQFLQQDEGGENTVSSSFTCIGWTEFLPLFYSWFRQEVIILQWGIRMEEDANEE